jgi:hypothetical protein
LEEFFPEVGIVASIDERETVPLHDIPVNEPFYLQIKMGITQLGRSNTEIPFTIEVSNTAIATFSEPQNVQYLIETTPMETYDNKLIYHYTAVAAREPKIGYISFKVTPKQAGLQTIKITYDKTINAIYGKTLSLEYKGSLTAFDSEFDEFEFESADDSEEL